MSRPTSYSVSHQAGGKSSARFSVGKDGKRRLETANVKALKDLQVGLVNNARFGKMVMYSIECVGKMAVDQTTVEEIAESGCLEAALNSCLLNPKNEQLQHQVNKTLLRAGGINQACAIAISESIKQDFSSFKNSIDTHAADETLTSSADVLCMLATAPEPEGQKNRDAMKAQGIYGSVAAKLAAGEVKDPKTIAALTQVLASGANDESVAQMIIDQGVFQQLMKDMEANPDSLELAQAFCALVASAAAAGPNILAQLKKMGIPGALSQVLTRFPHDKTILKLLGDAMKGLSDSNDVAPLMAVLRDTNTKGNNGLSDEDLLKQKLEASARLAMLTMVRSNLAFFKGGNGIGDVLASYNALIQDLKHYSSPTNLNAARPLETPHLLLEAMTQTQLMLQHISQNGAETQRYAILTGGGVGNMSNALYALRAEYDLAKSRGDHRSQALLIDAVTAGIDALAALMSRKENVQYLDQEGAIAGALEAAKGLLHYPALREAILGMMIKALAHPDVLSEATLHSMLDAVLEIIRTGKIPFDPEAAKKLAQAMCLLAMDEDSERSIIDAGGIPFLMKMLEQHKDSPDVLIEVLKALELALMTKEGMDAFIKAGGEDMLRQLKKLHKDNPELCAMIDDLLNMCREYREGRGVRASVHNAGQGQAQVVSQAKPTVVDEANLMLAGLMSQLQQPQAPAQPLTPRRMGMNNMEMEEQNEGKKKQGMTNMSIEDQQVAEGLDLMSQLRAFGLGGGLGAEMIPGLGMGSMGQNDGFDPNYSNTIITTTQLIDVPQDPNSLQAQHLLNTINQVQLYITERRAAKLLSLFESLFLQLQSYDRDYLLNAVLDGLAAICEEGFECENIIAQSGGMIPFEVQPYVNMLGYSNVLNELEQGLIENQVGDRLCERTLACTDELDLAVLSDNLATILSLITRDCVTLIHVKFGLKPQINPNVETDGQPYQSSNPFLSVNARKYAVNNCILAFQEAYADLMEQRELERQQLTIQRQLEVEKMKRLTQHTLSKENEMVLARIEKAKADAHAKAVKAKQEMQARLDKARREQEDKLKQMNEQAEFRRQQQIDSILQAARAATLAKVELEKRIAEGEYGAPKARTREDILRRLDDKTKHFLISGQLVTKYNELTGPSGRHLYVTPNLEYIVYRHAGRQEIKKSQMIKLTRFLGIRQGPVCKDLDKVRARVDRERLANDDRIAQGKEVKSSQPDTPAATTYVTDDDFDPDRVDLPGMHKESMWHGAIPRRASQGDMGLAEAGDDEIPTQYGDSKYFVLLGIDHTSTEREIGFECENTETCLKIVRAYTRLYEYASTLNEFQGEDTMQMYSNPLHNITQAEAGLSAMVAKEQEKSERINQWKHDQGIIGDNFGRKANKQPTFEDLLGDDDPWANE